ncbi:ribonuclease H-like domain-containing protein [Tanacetum coccineum]
MKNQGTPEVKGKNWNKIMERELGEGYSFIKKKCFVCGSLSHLIKDCDFYEKKMAREAQLKKQRVFNPGNGVAKPVWNNANRVNRANHFVPRPVQLNAVRSNVNTIRANVNSVRQNVNSVRTNVNTDRSKQSVPTRNSNSVSPVRPQGNAVKTSDHPLKNMEDRGIFDSGCSGHMTGNKDHLDDFEECKGGSVTFGGSKGYITGKGRIRVGNLDFDSVSFVKELGHFNLFSISQICDKHHKVLFTESECLVVSPDFKMPDENQILLKVPRQHNMYSFDMKTPSLTKDYACLIAKATSDESKLWHRRLGHINFKNLNKLVKGNLVRGLPSKVFFLATKDETSGILQNFIRQIENQLNHRVKIIRSDNGTEFKNRDMLEFCGNKGIKQKYSNARTSQQNRVAERMNRTLIEAARTMLADSLLPTTFGQKQLVLLAMSLIGCHVTILDTLSVLGKFDGKCDEGFLVEKPNVKGVGYIWMFDIDYLTDSMNYIPVSLENQTNPYAGTSEVNNSAAKVGPRKSSTNSKAEEFVIELENLKTQENEAYFTSISKDTPEILAFRKELDELAQNHLREVHKNKATSTDSVNFGSGQDNSPHTDQDDSDMPEPTIFNKPQEEVFDEASYDDEGMVHDFNNLPIEEEPKKISEALQDDS